MRKTTGRPYASETSSDSNRAPALGKLALWVGKRTPVIYQGNMELEGEEDKYSISLFYPKSDHTKAVYQGSISKNYGAGWETLGYIDFFKSKSDKLVAIGFIKWKGYQESTLRVLLFRSQSDHENAPKFTGIVIANEKDEEEDRPTVKKPASFRTASKNPVAFDKDSF